MAENKIPNEMIQEIAALTRQGRRLYFRKVQKQLKYSDDKMDRLMLYIDAQIRKLENESKREV